MLNSRPISLHVPNGMVGVNLEASISIGNNPFQVTQVQDFCIDRNMPGEVGQDYSNG